MNILPLSFLILASCLTIQPTQARTSESVIDNQQKSLNYPFPITQIPSNQNNQNRPLLQPEAPLIQPDEIQLEPATSTPLPPPEELLRFRQQTPPTPEPIPRKVPESITVQRFEFVGNTVITDEELAAVTEPFTHQPISFSQLFDARGAVTELYKSQGYVTSSAILPPQTLAGDVAEVVIIQIVEAGLEAINVTGTQRLNPEYIRSRIALGAGKPLNQKNLLEVLQLLQLNPLIDGLSAELTVGKKPGAIVLEVRVREADTFQMEFFVENNRPPSIGTIQRGLRFIEDNLFGQGDGVLLGWSNTEGSNTINFSYTYPLNPQNGTVGFSYKNISSSVVESPFDRLDLEADAQSYELSFRQPLLQTPNEQFAVGLRATRQETETTISEFPVKLSPGVEDDGSLRINALRFFQEWIQRSNTEAFAARSQFSIGIDAFGATNNEDEPDSTFLTWRGQAQWLRSLAEDTPLLLSTEIQLATEPLVSLEQFALGGPNTVRGYRQYLFLTDNGIVASAEARWPLLRLRQRDSLLQLATFVDFGTGWNNGSSPNLDPDSGFLASVGLGLRLQLGDLTARLDWGIPLVSVDTRARETSLQEDGIYFSVLFSAF